MRHFDPVLRTAVHIDASQNAVGAVLLQWQPNEPEPRPVAFMSHKLSGEQYRYDVHNAEALAQPSVLVLPVYKGQVAEQERDGASGVECQPTGLQISHEYSAMARPVCGVPINRPADQP
jgi:hypothetical protein